MVRNQLTGLDVILGNSTGRTFARSFGIPVCGDDYVSVWLSVRSGRQPCCHRQTTPGGGALVLTESDSCVLSIGSECQVLSSSASAVRRYLVAVSQFVFLALHSLDVLSGVAPYMSVTASMVAVGRAR